MLGAVLETVFKEDVQVKLHSFPAPNGEQNLSFINFSLKNLPFLSIFLVASGSFLYDVDFGDTVDHEKWVPTKTELMTLSAQMHRWAEKDLPLERLEVAI